MAHSVTNHSMNGSWYCGVITKGKYRLPMETV